MTAARFLADSKPDPSFGNGGGATIASSTTGPNLGVSNEVEVQPDGSVLIGGGRLKGTRNCYSAALARFTASGQPDSGFGSNGVAYTGTGLDCTPVSGMALAADAHILATWFSGLESALVARYTQTGQSTDDLGHDDPYFSLSVSGQTTYSRGLTIDSGGRLLLTGEVESEKCWNRAKITKYFPCIAAVTIRVMANGQLDESFGQAGIVTAPNMRICSRDPGAGCAAFPDARGFRSLVKRTLFEDVDTRGRKISLRLHCARRIREPCRISVSAGSADKRPARRSKKLVLRQGRSRQVTLGFADDGPATPRVRARVATAHQRGVTVRRLP